MAFDIIVFSQKELDNALENGCTSIALCDNGFVLPKVGNVCYTSIGSVTVSADGTKRDFENHGVRFDSFLPKFAEDISVTALPKPTSVSSFALSYTLSSYSSFTAVFHSDESCITVNGYGINLI